MICNIEITPGGVPPVARVSQYDTKRVITLQYDEAITWVDTVEIRGTRPDRAGIRQRISSYDLSARTISWTPNSDFTALAGDVVAEIVFFDGTQQLGSGNFILRVEPAALSENTPYAGATVTITADGTYNVAPYDEAIIDTGSSRPTGTKYITENGTYDITDYARASVDVEGGSEPAGTRYITENGNYDVRDYANASVNVEGGVTPTGTRTITTNGTYDIANYAQAVVNVPSIQSGVPLSVLDGETTPGSVDLDLSDANIGVLSGALVGNDSLRTIKIQARELSRNSLSDCTYAERVDLYDVESIGNSAFHGDARLEDVYLHVSSVPVLGYTVFDGTMIESGVGSIHCPASLEADFKQATNWASYAQRIVGDL